jgi:hypothetical protein
MSDQKLECKMSIDISEATANNKLSCKARNDLAWESHKEGIWQIYVEEDKTLKETMSILEKKCGFRKRQATAQTCILLFMSY